AILAVTVSIFGAAGTGIYFLRWPSSSPKIASLNRGVKLYPKPGSAGNPPNTLPKGTQVLMLGDKQIVAEIPWVKVRAKDTSEEGWIMERDLLQPLPVPTEEPLMPTASPTASPARGSQVSSSKFRTAKGGKPQGQAPNKKELKNKQIKATKQKKPE